MKFLSVLSKAFQIGLQIFTGFQTQITAAVPGTTNVVQTISQDLTEIAGVIVDVEQMSIALALKGPDKLKAAAPLVADIILKSTLLANHKVADAVLFQQGASKIADGMADCINSLHTNGATLVNKA